MSAPRDAPGELALHPVALIAMGVTFINDVYLKQTAPGWFTGKLSDLSGLAFFPFWVAAVLELLVLFVRRRWLVRQVHMLVIVAVTACTFGAIKVWPTASHGYERLVAHQQPRLLFEEHSKIRAHNSVDPSDLIALPALGVAVWVVRRRDARLRA
jgi:hypothetical protein